MLKSLDFYWQNLKYDIPSGVVVFLVALPLCLGVALASGAPLFAGLIAGMVGGLIVSWASGSQLSVSGPAAGLTVIVYNAIEELGSFQGFLVAVIVAGILQILFGYLKAGIISAYFPTPVIKGMLAAIGLILIMKQIPHAVGYDASFEGDESYMQETAESTLIELFDIIKYISPGATLVSVVALLILYVWETNFIKRLPGIKLFPGALIAVIWGVSYNALALNFFPEWSISPKHLVSLPVSQDAASFIDFFTRPDFSFLFKSQTYVIAMTVAVIASLETLLSLEAVDKLDPLKRVAPTNRELKAQGLGNLLSGLLGGLPITAVIVRSAANVNSGAKSKVSAFIHGYLLLMSVLFFAQYLNQIPLACLAAILLQTGYKLAKPQLFIDFLKKGQYQAVPFIVTISAILITDLLKGIIVGLAVGLYYVIRANHHAAISLTQSDNNYLLYLNKDVSFLNRALLRDYLNQIQEGGHLLIDASKTQFVDHDILETIDDFIQSASSANITVETIELHGKEKPQFINKKPNRVQSPSKSTSTSGIL